MNQHLQPDGWSRLSQTQRARWFAYQRDAASQGAHNNGFCARLHGPFDRARFALALQTLLARHAMLRAHFRAVDGEPQQRIAAHAEVPIRSTEASDVTPQALQRQVAADLSLPFDLGVAPLMRAHLYHCGAHETVLLLVFDHLAMDGWSYWKILAELDQLLRTDGRAADPARDREHEASYLEYVAAQALWLSGPKAQAQLRYWQDKLAGPLPTLEIGLAAPAAAAGHGRARHTIMLSRALSGQLRALGTQQRGTLFTTLLAAYTILLHRYTGQHDIIVGTPMPGRTDARWDQVVGDFVNPVALRTRLDDNPSVSQVLRSVRDSAMRAMANQDFPFSALVETLQLARLGERHPVFQTLFLFQKARHGADLLHLWDVSAARVPCSWGGFELEPFPVDQSGAVGNIGLVLEAIELDERIRCDFKFDTALFESDDIERMAAHFGQLLGAMAAAPDCPIGALEMLGSAERTRQLVAWNDSARAMPDIRTIDRLFAAQAARTPHAVALRLDGATLRYAELDARANRIAHHLLDLGAGPDILVGICAERSLDMVVGLLAILKAGAAYVPLDPAHPDERLAYMLEDSTPIVVLTQGHLLARLAFAPVALVPIDDGALFARQPAGDPGHAGPDGAHLAYVIYTSGSSGLPKAVMVEHASVVNLIEDWRARFCAGPHGAQLVAAFWTSFGFDVSVFELFVPLALGAAIHIVPECERADPERLLHWLHAERVSFAYLPPFFIRSLKEVADQRIAALCLRQVLVGVEALDEQALARLECLLPGLKIVNGYGPTEATIYCSTYACVQPLNRTAPLGRPIANTRIYVLDARGRLLPTGVPGEIHIGGAGVARGYLKRAQLTAERFVDDPFSAEPGARMYRTGDLGRWLEDGNLVYLGRNDFQLKIRGFRVEPGEIEARLCACAGVRDAVVVALEQAPGDLRLVAYLTTHEGRDVAGPELRRQLATQLAAHMLPSSFVVLAELPLTPNGKVDRAALPRPEFFGDASVAQAPRTPTQAILSGIWMDVLKREQLGMDDDFFELGGHSLLATQLVSRLRGAFGIDLPLRALFESPTIAALAHRIDHSDQHANAPAIVALGRGAAPALSFSQQRLWFLDQFERNSAFYNMPGAMRLRGRLDLAAFQASINDIVRRHDALRTTFRAVDGTPAQVIAPHLELAFPVTDLSAMPASAREARALAMVQEAARLPFDLAVGPLIRTSLIRLAGDDHIVLFTLHHIVSDGWSMGVLTAEVAALYAAFVEQRASPLPELPIQYADFAQWQRQWLSGDVLRHQLAYWSAQLAGAPALLTLPTDRPRPPVQTYRGATLAFSIDAATTSGLRLLSRSAQATLFMTLAAAFNVLLARYSGQSDICIGTPIANRNRAETEHLIGFFVNTLVLRSRIDSAAAIIDLVRQVRTTALDAYAHQDLPFEQLVDALKPERDVAHGPLFQVLLSLQNAPMGALALPGLTLEALVTDPGFAKFDLSLDVIESADTLQCGFEYNTDLFDRPTVERMARHFACLLAAAAADPGCRVADLPLMDDAERQRLLVTWNDTAVAHGAEPSLCRMFEAHAAGAPDTAALVCDGAALAYGELNARANRLAHFLRSRGVGPEVLVGICVERSPEMIVGLLAILKAGGAYVALDPRYPAERLAHMLADAAPALVLTQQRLLAALPAAAQAVFCLDSGWDQVAGRPSGDCADAGCPDNLAYVLYTSGSTGKPKGVGLSRGALHNLIAWQLSAPRESAAPARTLQFASLNFDVSFQEIFTTLCAGDTLVLIDDTLRQDMERLRDFVLDGRFRQVFLPNAVLQQFARLPLPPRAPQVPGCTILTAGEQLQVGAPLKALAGALGARYLYNQYGPSETHVATQFRLACGAMEDWAATPPIGRPIANTRVYLLDANLQPVPPGVAGELHVAGAGLGRGYLKRPGLTAEKFIPDPFSRAPGARMYKTGDLARFLADGEIDYLGRRDDQVKIRGFRIELGEIEAALCAVPHVRAAVVLARADGGERRLVAYVVPRDAALGCDAALLQSTLAQTLPHYMIPVHFVTLDKVPLTPNGKVDRQVLPAPNAVRAGHGYVAPASPSEHTLAAIWAEVLQLDRVGIHDNFFAIGGHSLLATQVMSKLRAAFGLEMPLRTLFEAPTIAACAARIDNTRWLLGAPTSNTAVAGTAPIHEEEI